MKNYNATLIYMVSIVTYIAGMIFFPNVSPGDKRVYIEQWDKWVNVEIVGWLYIMLPVIAIPVKMLLNAIFGTREHTGFTEKNYNPYSEAMAYIASISLLLIIHIPAGSLIIINVLYMGLFGIAAMGIAGINTVVAYRKGVPI